MHVQIHVKKSQQVLLDIVYISQKKKIKVLYKILVIKLIFEVSWFPY